MILALSKPHSRKYTRLPKRNRKVVTLFAGFRCADKNSVSENVFVICADSQETVEMPDGSSYRVARQKIKPKRCGNFEIAMGGSTQSGELLDACVHRIEESVTGWVGQTIPELKKFISGELLDFGRKDAKLYSKKDRVVDCLIMARSLTGGVECWRTRAAQLVPIERKVLVGWNENLYEHLLDRLYPEIGPLLPPQQAVLLGMHILKLAEDTSNYVRGPITVVVGQRGIIQELSPERVKRYQECMNLFRSQVEHILLSLADHTVRKSDYETKLDDFRATALQLRDDYIQQALPRSIQELINTNDVLPNLPVGGALKFGLDENTVFDESPETIARWQRRVEVTKIQGGAGPVILTIHCQCSRTFEVERPNFQTILGHEFSCECGKLNVITQIRDEDIRLKDGPPDVTSTEIHV